MPSRERLIQLIYAGVADDAAWAEALTLVADAVRASGAGIGVQNMATHEFWSIAQQGIDTALHPTYQRLAPENRIWQAIGRTGRPLADQMIMPKAEFTRTALHAEYFVPQGFHSVMAAPVLGNDSHCGVLVAFGSPRRGDFEVPDVADLADLAQHFSRAIGLRLDRVRLIADLRARNDVLDEARHGILFLDRTLRVRHMNAAAREVLAPQDALVLRGGRLACRDGRADAELQQALKTVVRLGAPASGGSVVVPCRNSAPLLLQVREVQGADMEPLAPGTAVVVRITDPEREHAPGPELLCQLFGLTKGEAKAVLAVSRHLNQHEAARRLGRAVTTLRTHLHRAYVKLGVHDPAGLARLLAAYGFFHAPDQV